MTMTPTPTTVDQLVLIQLDRSAIRSCYICTADDHPELASRLASFLAVSALEEDEPGLWAFSRTDAMNLAADIYAVVDLVDLAKSLELSLIAAELLDGATR